MRHSSLRCRCPCRGSRFDQGGEERDQSFGADLIGRFPDEEQGVLDFWSRVGQTCLLTVQFRICWMVEEVNGIFTSIASNGDECIQQKDLVCMRCFLIPRCHLLDQFPPGLIASC